MPDIGSEILLRCGKTREVIELVRNERQLIEAGSALPQVIEADCAYLDFFIRLFEDAAGELEALGAELDNRTVNGHDAGQLRRIAQRACDGRRRCLEFFDNISLEIRNELLALQGLDVLADRIAPKPPEVIDRRTLFTRLFTTPRARS